MATSGLAHAVAFGASPAIHPPRIGCVLGDPRLTLRTAGRSREVDLIPSKVSQPVRSPGARGDRPSRSWWRHGAPRRAGRVSRRPFCIGCKASFADLDAEVGAFMFAMPLNIDGLVATSALCVSCYETLPASEVDAVCTRTLQQLAPRGRFLDLR